MEKRFERKKDEYVQIFSKENSWVAKVNKEEFEIFKKEGYIKKEQGKNKYVTLFTDNEMDNYIKEREEGKCYNCGKEGEKINWLVPKEMGGYDTPANKVFECRECFNIRKEKSQTKQIEESKSIKEKNINHVFKRINNKYKCQMCKEEKEIEHIKFLSKSGILAYCKKCFDKSNDGIVFIIDENGIFVGTGDKEYLKEYWEEGKVDYESKKIAKIFEEPKKKRCILCGKMKWNNSYRKKENGDRKSICKTCEKEKSLQGVISLFDTKNKEIGKISTDEEVGS